MPQRKAVYQWLPFTTTNSRRVNWRHGSSVKQGEAIGRQYKPSSCKVGESVHWWKALSNTAEMYCGLESKAAFTILGESQQGEEMKINF